MKLVLDTNPKFFEVPNKNRTFISMIFYFPYDKSDLLKIKMINRMLLNFNNNFHDFHEFKRKKEDLYIIEYNFNVIKFPKYAKVEFRLCIPKLGIIDEFDLDAVFKFIYESMFNPFVNNESFDEKAFNEEKDFILENEKDFPNSIEDYAVNQFLNFYDEDKVELHYDDYIKLLKEVNSKDTYEYYKKNIKENNFITYIYGNLDYKDEILKCYNKYFKQDYKKLEYDIEIFNYLPLKKYKEKELITKYNQSVMMLLYQIKDIKDNDYFIELMLYYFLNSNENNLIFTNLRNKNNLIYHCGVSSSPIFGFYNIYVFYNNGDEDKILNIINDVFESIKVKENFDDYKSRLVRALKYDIYSSLDNDFNKVFDIIDKETNYYYTLQEKLDNIENITYEDMLNLLNRVILTRKLIMIAGEKNE